ncbi:Lipase [Lachnellula suecica]|uniref:Carboxylic ester hydrolase n=1 Tax=Lachnellula suecica TaxID=602035 RepID=A0A8T9CFJ7_9HELO|nr:Lipase [Lachnellula suecica]
MIHTKLLVQLVAAVLLPLSHAAPNPHSKRASSDVPDVTLDNGLVIQGTSSALTPNVKQYLGIPYAQPPLDDLRFAPPQAYDAVSGTVINGTTLPPSCMQYITKLDTMVTVDVPQFEIGAAGMSEDCLTTSVFAPVDAEGLPVLIWVFGGGFVTGGTDVPYQMPEQWVELSQSHIVVSMNYRVNIFGYPNAAGLDDQNVGFLDQRLAVQWVQQNIAKFGGDPARMVLWGQSAGAMSVDVYNYAWASDPIVTGYIMDSGTTHLDILKSVDTTHSNFSSVARNLGCANQTDAAAELACMRSVTAEAIEEFLEIYQDGGVTPTVNFFPIVDEKTLFSNYTEKALNGEISDVPAIITFNANEGVFLLPYDVNGPDQATADYISYSSFWCPATVATNERLSAGLTTYRLFYTGNFTNTSPAFWMGASHGSELPLIFGTHANFRGNSTAFEWSVSEALQAAYLAFVTDPQSGLAGVDWPAYEGAGGSVRIFAENETAVQIGTVADIEAGCAQLGLL